MIDLSSTRNRLSALGGLAAIAVLWIALAPTQLGGPTSFASIVGVSMEPHLRAGDLVVVRRSADYRVGQVVAYRSSTLHRIVLHRILSIDGGRYTFKGDNNSFVDPGSATRADLVGREWLRLPGMGRWFERLHKPWVASLLAVLAVVVVFGTGRVPRRGRGARARRAAASVRVPAGLEPLIRPVLLVAAAASFAYLLLAAVSLALPTQRPAPVDDLYDVSGTFAYGGSAPISDAYPTGQVSAGATVFTKLVDRVEVSFRWRLDTGRPHDVHGTAALGVVVADGSGWSRRLPLAPPHPFIGDTALVRGSLDLAALQRLVAGLQRETGTNVAQYRVALAPRIVYDGRIGDSSVSDSYAPTLDFVLTEQALQLATAAGTTSPGLVRSESKSGSAPAANRVGLGPVHVDVATARWLGIGGTVLSLLVLAAALLAARRLDPEDEIQRELTRAGVTVVRIADERWAARLDVDDLAGLLLIARRYDRVVLYAQRTGAYLVEDDDVVYRWRPPGDGSTTGAEWPNFLERRNFRTRPWSMLADEPLAEAGEA